MNLAGISILDFPGAVQYVVESMLELDHRTVEIARGLRQSAPGMVEASSEAQEGFRTCVPILEELSLARQDGVGRLPVQDLASEQQRQGNAC